jgi:hypothetical protein
MQELRALEGDAAADRAIGTMPEALAFKLRTSTLASTSWYPIEEYAAMWTAIQEATGHRRDLPRQIGRRCVQHDLTVVHKLVLSVLSVPMVMTLTAKLFNGYYDTGASHCDRRSERLVRVFFKGCTGFTVPMWAEIRGSVEMFAEAASGGKASSIWRAGGGEGDRDGELDVWWS